MNSESGHGFERRFLNRFEDLDCVTQEAVQYLQALGIGARSLYTATLAIEELGTNILKYGYDDNAAHEILLRLEVEPGAVHLVLEDDGHEFNPVLAREPDLNQPPEERPTGGLGLHLLRKMVDQITYARLDGRNRVTVRIRY